jgi:transposase
MAKHRREYGKGAIGTGRRRSYSDGPGKKGSKRNILVDGAGIPLSLELTGANVRDVKRIQEILDGVVVGWPEWTGIPKEHLCADKGYYGESALEIIVLRGYIPRVVRRGEEKAELAGDRGKEARRWVVGWIFSWLNRFRKPLVRYEKKAVNYCGLLMFACAFICFRQIDAI